MRLELLLCLLQRWQREGISDFGFDGKREQYLIGKEIDGSIGLSCQD